MGGIVAALLTPLVTKLAGSESSPLVVQLLLVLAQLTLINTNQLIACLAAQPAPGLPTSCFALVWHICWDLHDRGNRFKVNQFCCYSITAWLACMSPMNIPACADMSGLGARHTACSLASNN